MALITSLSKIPTDRSRVHKTHVECGWAIFENDGSTYLQLETRGSTDRQDQGTVSQTLQFGSEVAHELRKRIDEAFGAR